MTNDEAEFQTKLCFMQLDLMRTYENDLVSRFGKRGYFERIDIILDKLIISLSVQRKFKLK